MPLWRGRGIVQESTLQFKPARSRRDSQMLNQDLCSKPKATAVSGSKAPLRFATFEVLLLVVTPCRYCSDPGSPSKEKSTMCWESDQGERAYKQNSACPAKIRSA
eukprot:4128920-Amphidinium_carterae.1